MDKLRSRRDRVCHGRASCRSEGLALHPQCLRLSRSIGRWGDTWEKHDLRQSRLTQRLHALALLEICHAGGFAINIKGGDQDGGARISRQQRDPGHG